MNNCTRVRMNWVWFDLNHESSGVQTYGEERSQTGILSMKGIMFTPAMSIESVKMLYYKKPLHARMDRRKLIDAMPTNSYL